MANKFGNFVSDVETLVEDLDTNQVKKRIGDSTNNNRTLSVNQLIRYLSDTNSRTNKTLARNLSASYSIIRPLIRYLRDTNRTDAIDITEFITVANGITSTRDTKFISRRLL